MRQWAVTGTGSRRKLRGMDHVARADALLCPEQSLRPLSERLVLRFQSVEKASPVGFVWPRSASSICVLDAAEDRGIERDELRFTVLDKPGAFAGCLAFRVTSQ